MNQISFFDYRDRFGVEIIRGEKVKHDFCRHTHQRLCLGLVESGERSLLCGEKRHRVAEGEMFLLPPGQAHACEAKTEHSYQLLLVENELLEELLPNADYGNAKTVFDGLSCREQFRQLPALLSGDEYDFLKQEQLLAFLAEALEAANVMVLEGPTDAADEETLIKVRRYIEENYVRTITLEELAKTARLSQYHLLRRFARCFGVPPHAYLQQERIRQARRLLASGHSGAEVALAVGFGDQSHFCNVFKKLMGISPARYAEAIVNEDAEKL